MQEAKPPEEEGGDASAKLLRRAALELGLHDARFGFDGRLVHGGGGEPAEGEEGEQGDGGGTHDALHHHGDEPDKPGYTLPELFHPYYGPKDDGDLYQARRARPRPCRALPSDGAS